MIKRNLVEAALNWYDQERKMRELESGARKFNAGAASDDKLIFNRKVCISYKLPYALSVVETEMLKRGLISSRTSLSATGSTSATSTSKSAPSGSSTNSSSIDYSKISLVNSAAYSKVWDADWKKICEDIQEFDDDPKSFIELTSIPGSVIGNIYTRLAQLIVATLINRADIINYIKDEVLTALKVPAVELKRVIKEVLDDKKTLSIITNALGLNESLIKTKIVEDLEKTTPYMLRNDGAFLTCGDIHPYIKMQYKQPFDETYKALLTNYEFLDWFYYNTTNNEVKDLICKFLTLCEQTPNIIELKDKFGITNSLILGDDSLEKITNRLNDLTNQEFCRARTSNFKYKYGGDNGEIYFRISSKNFNWFDLIWQVVSDYSVSIKFVTIMKDYAATGERFKYLSYKGKEFNKMPINEFLALSGNPVVESLNESEGKQDTLNPKLWDGMELKPEVKEKIDMIVNEFLETLNQDDIDNIKISDIILVGSNVSYNYTSNSDIDIHIRIDLSIYDEPEQRNIMSRLVSAYAKVWNNKYTISFYGIPVELFIETKFDVDEDWQLL